MLKKTLAKNKERWFLNEEQTKKDLLVHDENQYINLISDILTEGSVEEGRNGTTVTIIGSSMHFNLEDNTIPFMTSKKLAWKTCLKELLWFIKGDTSNERLQQQNVKIWNGNASREFLDSRGLHYLKENDLGPVYGHQWRFFNAPYENCDSDWAGEVTYSKIPEPCLAPENTSIRTMKFVILCRSGHIFDTPGTMS